MNGVAIQNGRFLRLTIKTQKFSLFPTMIASAITPHSTGEAEVESPQLAQPIGQAPLTLLPLCLCGE
jgi:hypothetical protein